MQIIPPLNCGQSFKLVCKNYCKFSGRSRRSEFFYFYIYINIILVILYPSMLIVAINSEDNNLIILLLIPILIYLVTFIPILSSMVRRLHDIGRSGYHVLSIIIPVFFTIIPLLSLLGLVGYIGGQIYIIILCCTDSQQMSNEFGPSPKYIMNSGNLTPGNNYFPPKAPINAYPQPNPMNFNYPFPQYNSIQNQGNSFPQQNSIQNQGNPFPQQNSIQNQGNPFPQQNPIQNQGNTFSQQNPIQNQGNTFSQNINNLQINPIQKPNESDFYPPLDNPYSKPNPMQP